MRISKISDLVDGRVYWYVGICNQCHWEVYHTHQIYKNDNNWSKMIVFDNEEDAILMEEMLQRHINPYTIK